VGDFQETVSVMDTLTERYGRVTDYRPEPDGTIAPERMETFLAARDAAAPVREDMERTLSLLAGSETDDEGKLPRGFIGKMRAGMGLLPGIAEFFTIRNDALLDAGMGLGEYCYIYTVAYFSWLGHSPADGPPFTLVGDAHVDEDHDREMDEFEVRERRLEDTLRRLNRQILPMLHHQLEALDEAPGGSGGDAWRQALAAEIEAMEGDPYRLPWRDGVPGALESSLDPFRERLRDSYSELCNPLEVSLGQH
jgi:hypothetical protein